MTTTTDESLQAMLNRIDRLTELLSNAHISERFQEEIDMMKETEMNKLQQLEETKHEVKELESLIEISSLKEQAIKKAYDDKVERVTVHKGEIAQYDIEIEQDENKCKELEKEIEEISRQLDQLSQPEESIPSVNQGFFQTTLFASMGVEMKLDKDRKARKVTVSSPNGQDFLTFSLEDFSPDYTAQRIWDFISKN